MSGISQSGETAKYLASLLLFILGILPYLVNLQGEFLLDDIEEIKNNANIKQVWPLNVCMWESRGFPVRPVPYLTFALNYAVHGDNTLGYHLVNIFIHGVSGILIYLTLSNLSCLPRLGDTLGKMPSWFSWIVALIWLVHPLQTMPVNYIYQRIELIYSCCMLASIWLFSVAVTTPGGNLYASFASIITCSIGMASKEVMLVTPFLILLIDYLIVVNQPKELLSSQRLVYYLFLFSTIFILLFVIWGQQSSYNELKSSRSSLNYLFTQSSVILHYVRLSVIPHPLIFDYEWPVSEIGIAGCWWQFSLHTLMLFLLFYSIIRRKVWGMLIGWFYGILAPTSSVLPLNLAAVEYRMYLPLLSLIIAFVYLLQFLCHSLLDKFFVKKAHQILFTSLILVAVVSAYLSSLRSLDYRTFMGIWEMTMKSRPMNWRPPFILADHQLELGNHVQAEKLYLQSLTLNPANKAILYNHLGIAIMKQGRLVEANQYFNEANKFAVTTYADPLFNLGLISEESNLQEAYRYYQAALAKNPKHVDAHINLGIILANYPEKYQEAFLHFKTALELEPENEHARNNFQGFQRMMLEMQKKQK